MSHLDAALSASVMRAASRLTDRGLRVRVIRDEFARLRAKPVEAAWNDADPADFCAVHNVRLRERSAYGDQTTARCPLCGGGK